MAELPHLILPRAEVDLERRKKKGFGSSTPREFGEQSERVKKFVEEALEAHSQLRATTVDPALIVRVRVSHLVPEEQWNRAGLAVLGHDENGSVILFASSSELQEFHARLGAYAAGIPEGQKGPQYDALIGAIEELRGLGPEDRIGPRLRDDGFGYLEAFAPERQFALDVELWEVGPRIERELQVARFETVISAEGGELADTYIGTSFTALRVIGNGGTFQRLLNDPLVRSVDLPPQADVDVRQLLETALEDAGTIAPPDDEAPLVGIIDSGVNDAHPLLKDVVVERLSDPVTLGLSDGWGHGSKVSGIAAYGNVRECLEREIFQPLASLVSGKVVNDEGNFDDRRLVPAQMDEIVRALHQRGCRIFNISLGDRSSVYAGGKVGLWTAVLDQLARELDILFIVSAGNYEHVPGDGNPEDHILGYPNYLLKNESRVLEPGTAVNALTVGAIAHSAAVREPRGGDVGLRPIAEAGEPAPFTRCGPGVAGAIKPDLCDDGGNMLYDGITQSVLSQPESEVFTTHPKYLERLFTTVRGTSYAAPLVAHKAAIVLRAFPQASANLIRALLTSSAQIPHAAVAKLTPIRADAVSCLCGHGIADSVRASTSDTNRVVLYADSEIGMDKFFVYEVPVPREFANRKGTRHIRVTLAFDPPTRHSRAAYLGVEMSFRLIRGKRLEEIVEHFRKRNEKIEGRHPDLDDRYNCQFDIGPQTREKGTLQSGTFTMKSNPAGEYGDLYYLVIRCERQWHPDEFDKQRFAVVVELMHSTDIQLYERVRERVEVRVRA